MFESIEDIEKRVRDLDELLSNPDLTESEYKTLQTEKEDLLYYLY